jgi:DNA replication protein DnaC
LLIVDEVGYIPFDAQAANLMFSLVSSRYERASLIVTSNKPFSAWGEIFGDETVAAAMIDRVGFVNSVVADFQGNPEPAASGISAATLHTEDVAERSERRR